MHNQAPIYSSFSSIYPGPHITDDGKVDDRVWFSIPIEIDTEDSTITYLVFPYGGSEDEVRELTIEAPPSWIA